MPQHPGKIGALAGEAFSALRDRPWPIIGAGCLLTAATGTMIASAVLFQEFAELRQLSEEARLAFTLVAPPLLVAVHMAVWLLGLHVALRTTRREPIAWSAAPALVGPALVLHTLGQALALVGTLACLAPGVVVSVGLSYGQWFLADRRLGPLAALSASWAATRGLRMAVFGLVVSLTLLVGLAGLVTVGAAVPVAFAVMLLMGASSHEFLAARVFTRRAEPPPTTSLPAPDAQPEPATEAPRSPALDAPAVPVPAGLWVVAVMASLAAFSLWDPEIVKWLFRVLSRSLPSLEEPQVMAAVAGAVVAPALVVLLVGLRLHTRHRATALDARGLWLDATPRDGRLVPWAQVEWFDVVGDGVRLKLRGQWSGLGPLVAVPEAERAAAAGLLEAQGVPRREG